MFQSKDLRNQARFEKAAKVFINIFKGSFKLMDRLPYRQKFLNDRNSKICYHSLKDHPKVSKIAKFRCEML